MLLLLAALPAHAQKKVSEFTLVYDYTITGAPAETNTHTIYLKGNKSRSELSNALFSSTVLYDANSGTGVILREVSGQKLLIRLTPDNWQEKNRPYDGLVFKNTGETRDIAGYKCVRATAVTKSGATLNVYYTRDIIPDNRDYDPQFSSLDGLPLEYELINGKMSITYKISRISFNPVPASKFDIPKTGYREMSYEESKKLSL